MVDAYLVGVNIHFLDKHPQGLANWISSLNFNERQDAAFEKYTKDTGSWMLQSPEFTEWVQDDRCRILWCPGNREFLVFVDRHLHTN